MFGDVPSAEWAVPTQIFEGDILFIEWSAKAANSFVEDGIDTFVFRDGEIVVQTVRYTLLSVNIEVCGGPRLDTCQDRDDEAPPRGGGRARRPRALPPRQAHAACPELPLDRTFLPVASTSPSTRRRLTAASRWAGAGALAGGAAVVDGNQPYLAGTRSLRPAVRRVGDDRADLRDRRAPDDPLLRPQHRLDPRAADGHRAASRRCSGCTLELPRRRRPRRRASGSRRCRCCWSATCCPDEVRFRFTAASGGEWQVDDVYVDPYSKG